MPFLIDRTRLQCYYDCPRKFWWNYVSGGLGVTKAHNAIPLVVGGSVHKGLELLLRGTGEDDSVTGALAEFEDRVGSGLALEPSENARFVRLEQRGLVEALVRTFARRGLPRLLDEYEILEVEQEDTLELAPNIVLMARADGLLRKRSNSELYILSFKTAKKYDGRLSSDANHDVQGLSEAAIVESRLGEEVLGTLMIYLIKGVREEYPNDSGNWQQNSSLVHPWVRGSAGNDVGIGDLAHSWKWRDSVGGHTLGKGWYKGNVWELMPMRSWIDLLESGQVQPEAGDPLESIIICPPPLLRRKSEAEDWLEQTKATAFNIMDSVQDREFIEEDGETFRHYLNRAFHQNRRSCDWPTKCQFQDICFGPAGNEPIESGLYIERTPHHKMELDIQAAKE